MGDFFVAIIVLIFVINVIHNINKDLKIKSAHKKYSKEFNRRLPEYRTRTKAIVDNCKSSMYIFARRNKRMRKLIYDIEEGGDYLTEYNKTDLKQVDRIVEEELKYQSIYFFQDPETFYSFPTQINNQTFEKIKGHFIRIFRGLFNPGDEADLKLEENTDALEAKIHRQSPWRRPSDC